MSERNYDDKTKWIKMTVSDLTTPKPGRIVYGARWWSVTPDDCVLFFKSYCSPQCNVNREVCAHIKPELEQRYIEFAFVPHDCRDYV